MSVSMVLEAPRLKPCGNSILQQIPVFCVQNYMSLAEPRFLSFEISFSFYCHLKIICKKKTLLSMTSPVRTLRPHIQV